jgi:hypothetical protein
MHLTFDPDRVAYLETAGWRAYYDHRWAELLRLMLSLNRDQFHMPAPAAVLAAYYTVQASRAWAPAQNRPDRALYYLSRFYRQAQAHSGLAPNPAHAAQLELDYWDLARRINREISRDRLLHTMTALHAEIFGISHEAAAESAELRVQAIELLREITGESAADREHNWREIEDRLRRCYRSALDAIRGGTPPGASAGSSSLAIA